jgi:hypothetical protein
VNVVLSNDDDDNEPTCLRGQNVPAADDAGGARTNSVEAAALGPAGAGSPGTTRSLAANRVPAVAASSACGWKRPHPTVKRSDPGHQTNHVMIQVELPPYHGPRSPLDLVALEIVFGHMFEVFRRVPQAKPAIA